MQELKATYPNMKPKSH